MFMSLHIQSKRGGWTYKLNKEFLKTTSIPVMLVFSFEDLNESPHQSSSSSAAATPPPPPPLSAPTPAPARPEDLPEKTGLWGEQDEELGLHQNKRLRLLRLIYCEPCNMSGEAARHIKKAHHSA